VRAIGFGHTGAETTDTVAGASEICAVRATGANACAPSKAGAISKDNTGAEIAGTGGNTGKTTAGAPLSLGFICAGAVPVVAGVTEALDWVELVGAETDGAVSLPSFLISVDNVGLGTDGLALGCVVLLFSGLEGLLFGLAAGRAFELAFGDPYEPCGAVVSVRAGICADAEEVVSSTTVAIELVGVLLGSAGEDATLLGDDRTTICSRMISTGSPSAP
jgi:hypothetical protein